MSKTTNNQAKVQNNNLVSANPDDGSENHAIQIIGKDNYNQLVSSFDSAGSYEQKLEVCEGFIASDTMPRGYDNPYAVMTAIEMGKAFGIPPVAAIFSIDIIQGSPRPSARLLASAVWRLGGAYTTTKNYEPVYGEEKDDKGNPKVIDMVTEITFMRVWNGVVLKEPVQFSLQEANALGYIAKSKDKGKGAGPWVSQRPNMMWWRCMSRGAKRFFPDSEQSKFYTADEWLDVQGVTDYKLTDQGEVVYTNNYNGPK